MKEFKQPKRHHTLLRPGMEEEGNISKIIILINITDKNHPKKYQKLPYFRCLFLLFTFSLIFILLKLLILSFGYQI